MDLTVFLIQRQLDELYPGPDRNGFDHLKISRIECLGNEDGVGLSLKAESDADGFVERGGAVVEGCIDRFENR